MAPPPRIEAGTALRAMSGVVRAKGPLVERRALSAAAWRVCSARQRISPASTRGQEFLPALGVPACGCGQRVRRLPVGVAAQLAGNRRARRDGLAPKVDVRRAARRLFSGNCRSLRASGRVRLAMKSASRCFVVPPNRVPFGVALRLADQAGLRRRLVLGDRDRGVLASQVRAELVLRSAI